jgi:multicomponent Na+:H+ antiporter subunit E
MNLFALNLMLALGWAAVTGSFTLANLALGFALGYGVLWLTRGLYPSRSRRYISRFPRALRLAGYFLVELVLSSLRVAWDVVTPSMHARPGILRVPLRAESDLEILVTANLISLTPGSLALDVSPDRSELYVHLMFLSEADKDRRAIQENLERRVLEVLR